MRDRFQFIFDNITPPLGQRHEWKVLNLGCCGNPHDKWHELHDGLVLRCGADNVVGVDLWGEGVERMRQEGHMVYWGSVEKVDECVPGGMLFDVVVAGELIEHLTNPASFLESAKRVLKPAGKLIITTPNSWALWNLILYGFMGREEIHPEHVAVLNRDCLKKMLNRHGWRIETIDYLLQESSSCRRFRWLKEIPERWWPRLRPIIGCVAEVITHRD